MATPVNTTSGDAAPVNQITRRSILAATAASAAVVAPAGLALASATPDPLVALEASFLDAAAEFYRVCQLLDMAEGELIQDGVCPTMPSAIVGHWHCMSPNEVMRHCQPLDPDGPDEETGLAIVDDLGARRRDYEAARIDNGLGPLQDAMDTARDRYDDVLRAIAMTPAMTIAGLAVKLRLVKRDIDEGTTEYSDDLIDGAVADVERLSGGGS